MPDLTLNEYRGLSEHELRRVLKEEALKMFGADAVMQKKVVVPLSDNSRKGTGSDRRKGKPPRVTLGKRKSVVAL
jgi:hypothetical protein